MDADEPGWPIIDDFFRDLAVGRSVTTARRYLRVRARLYRFLDTADLGTALGPALGEDAATALERGRQTHASGSFWALYGLDELSRCLPAFVHEPWLPVGLAEARTQLSVVSRLAARLGATPASSETAVAVVQARERLDRRPPVIEPARMPARFLAHPGPLW